jgi:glycine/D-amino acid oxidase-like deaminating enzyme
VLVPPNMLKRSLWLDLAVGAPRPEAVPALHRHEQADVCIVGGGLLGLWTAIWLRERDPMTDVVVIEARTCGHAASGRNAGYVMSMWHNAPALIARVGTEEARRVALASDRAVAELERFCVDEDIDCGFRRPGWLWSASAPAQVGSWRSTVHAAAELGGTPFEPVGAEDIRHRLGSPVQFGGLFVANCGTVDPGRLVAGLRRAALRRGVRLFEHSPMLSFDRRTQTVACPYGAVRSGQLILATNAWLATLPELRRVVVPLTADAVATEPIPEILSTRWAGGEAYTNSRMMLDFGRPTPDGRVLFGRGAGAIAFGAHLGSTFHHDAGRTAEIRAALARFMPVLNDVDITHAWAGPIDRSYDGLPLLGRLPGSPVLFGGGFSGNGLVPTMLVSRSLSAMALGVEDEWSNSPLAGVPIHRFPPEPIRFLGGHLVRAAVRAREEALDNGRRPGFVVGKLADQAPASLLKPDVKPVD